MNQVIKSSFPPMRPQIDPAVAQKLAASTKASVKVTQVTHPKAEPKESQPPRAPAPLPENVELWIEVVERPERIVFGWPMAATRGSKTKAVLIALNRHHSLVRQCFDLGDCKTLALLAGICLAEFLYTHRKRETWAAATLAKLRETLLPEDQRHIQGVPFLAQTLADSDLFVRLSTELIAPDGAKAGKRQFGIVNLVEPAELQS